MVSEANEFNGDYVEGDKIYGDKVLRDKVIIGGDVISVRSGQHERRSIFPDTKKRVEYSVLIKRSSFEWSSLQRRS